MPHTQHQTLLQLDHHHCWHPFTQAQTAQTPLLITHGHHEFLMDAQGQAYFDAASSWWVNLHGHSNPHIAQAIAQQAQQLEHVMFAGITHPPAIQLAQRLTQLAPYGLNRVFYSDNGSTAVEVALKMAFQYHSNQGQALQKHKLIALEGGYHGDTFGAMAAGRSSGFYNPFRPWLFDVEFIPTGVCERTEQQSLTQLQALLAEQPDQIAALIIEPLVQGASGMRMMRPQYIAELIKACKQAHVLVIFDEVMTGFGRTGTLFAADQVAKHDGYADLLCVSKGLTGGFMPMGATLATEALYEAFLDDDVGKAFLHGHSYTANPLGCAAALASLDLLEQPDTQQRIQAIETIHRQWLTRLHAHPLIENPRVCGTIAAFEIKSGANGYGSANSQWLRQAFLAHHIVVRPLGNTLYWIPPYCTQPQTLNHAWNTLFTVLEQYETEHPIQHQTTQQNTELF